MALAFWNGDGFDVQPWGVVPTFDYRTGRWPVRMFDGVHSDLAVGTLGKDWTLAIAPWTLEGPGKPVVVEPPRPDYVIALFRAQTVLDVNGDGLDEIAVLVQPFVHRLVGNVDGVPSFFGDELTHDGKCGRDVAGIGAGDFDGDGLVDVAAIGHCEVRNLGGIFAFAAEWGDGAGGFASQGVTFSATSPSAWLGVADFDGDGFDDVMTAPEVAPGYEVYLDLHRSRGDRTFDPPLKFWTELDPPGSFIPPYVPPLAATTSFVFGDVDGDGADDVVFQEFMLAVVQVAGETQYLEMFDIAWDEDSTQMVSAFDLNEDGRLDFLVWDVVEGAYALMSSS
ncbi:MAG: VCBS repeat-containing protein [Deltaproteobacteria bacterium]|nr:VCBS repeat-containing protein [Deltaproteobacteria bacterium]